MTIDPVEAATREIVALLENLPPDLQRQILTASAIKCQMPPELIYRLHGGSFDNFWEATKLAKEVQRIQGITP